MIEEDDAEELELRDEIRKDAKAAISKPWTVERRDNRDGSIAYEIWSDDGHHRVCRIIDSDNPTAKRDAEHMAALHNASLSPSPASRDGVTDAEICTALDDAAEGFDKLRVRQAGLVKALEQIACFDDMLANDRLATNGSYSLFDEPGSVRIAREALATYRNQK